MCGIAGIVSESLAADGRLTGAVARMLSCMRHRGPDGEGVQQRGSAALGAVRLAVIDPRPVPQPVVSTDGRFVMAYNGEIYDHEPIRAELQSKGVRFATRTDTEVAIEAFREWGPAALRRFTGMFAFVLLDTESGELFGARDRLGKKPMFLHEAPGTFAWSSFLPSFLEIPGFAPSIDPRSVLDIVEQGYALGPKSIWREVTQIPPGHAFTWKSGRLEIFEWWSARDAFLAGRDRSPRDVARDEEDFEERLTGAVRARLVSDVPLGALLSGGLDSSTIVALMSEGARERVKTFTVAFDVPGFDESAHAALVARALGTEHHVRTLKLDDEAPLLDMQRRFGEPLADTSSLPTSLAFAVARENVTVALSGDGADELLAGYETFRADALLQLLRRLPAWPTQPALRALARAMPVDHGKVSLAYRLRKFASGLDLPDAVAHSHWRALQGHADALRLLDGSAREALGGWSATGRILELDARVAGLDLVNRASYLDVMTYLPDDILVKVDRASMARSVEARAPFLDHHLVELLARLPGRDKLRGWTSKWILRRLARTRLPPSVLRRRKEGFSSPVSRWLTGSMRGLFFDTVTADRCARLGLDVRRAHEMHAELASRREFHGYRLWAVLILCLWDATLPPG